MENPISTIKSNVSVAKIIGFVILSVVVFAILDFLNLTNWILYPVSQAKAAYAKAKVAATAVAAVAIPATLALGAFAIGA